MQQNAYVTTIFGGDTYVGAAMVLAQSLRNYGATAKLVIMATEDVSAEAKTALATFYDSVVDINTIEVALPAQLHGGKRFKNMYTWLPRCFTKLHAFELEGFAKICLLDADMVAVGNPDQIFELRAPAGICSVVTEAEGLHGKRIPESILRKSMFSYGMRGCLLLLEPSKTEFAKIMTAIIDDPTTIESRGYIGPDEKMLTEYFWKRWTNVSNAYGCTSWKTEDVVPILLHFVSEKPWNATQDWPDFRIWWAVADAIVSAQPAFGRFFTRSKK